jgi:hypothetical protein
MVRDMGRAEADKSRRARNHTVLEGLEGSRKDLEGNQMVLEGNQTDLRKELSGMQEAYQDVLVGT